MQTIQLYKRLYNEKTVFGLWKNFSSRWPIFRPPKSLFGGSGVLLSATLFSFSANGIADEDMINAATSFTAMAQEHERSSTKKRLLDSLDCKNWELVTDQKDFFIWRRLSTQYPSLYEYRCAGSFYDVPAAGFYIAQIDLEYRKQWDQLVIVLDVIDADTSTGSEVVRWVTHFPFPMYPREYVYVRRSCVDKESKTIVLTSKTVNHPRCHKDDSKYVRVENYYSCMVIKPHKEFHEDGFDYVLTYFDDPKAPFPTPAYNWMVTTGVPGFVQKVYNAAKALSSNKTQTNSKSNRYADLMKYFGEMSQKQILT
jgi:hypothetical protein